MTPEKKFWNKIRDNLKLDKMSRIENILEEGWPDVFYMHDGYPGWIELKAQPRMPGKISYEPAQPVWLEDYWAKGGTCWTWLYLLDTSQIWVWAGKDARKIASDIRAAEPAAQVLANRKGWDALYDLIAVQGRTVLR
jgi:hypothetical protein